MPDFIQINTTSDQSETLQRIARHLVEHKLAACVQIGGPVQSVYHWNDKVETAEEWTCSIKTTRTNLDEIQQAIADLHHYEVPQIIVLPIVAGSQKFLDWVQQQTQQTPLPDGQKPGSSTD